MINEKVTQKLAHEIINFINLRRDKKDETFLKAKLKKSKKGGYVNGSINEKLILSLKKQNLDDSRLEDIVKLKKNKEQTGLEFQQKKFAHLLSLASEHGYLLDVHEIQTEYQEFKEANNYDHQPKVWLSEWVKKAKDISFATHVAKLTHSSSKGTSVLDSTQSQNSCYLTTNSLPAPALDTASSNAASLPIADVLKLAINGVSVIDCLKDNDFRVLEYISQDRTLAREWFEHLKQAYDSSQKQSYFLSKQTYFPIENDQYHLLLPLTSSSIVQKIYLKNKEYFDEEQTLARSQKNNKKYSPVVTCSYPNKANLNVTGSNHSNASSLNGNRGGRISLLPTMPPEWQSRSISYANNSNIFEKPLSYDLSFEIGELRKYLLLLKNKELSISEPKRNAAILEKLEAISSAFFEHISSANSQEVQEGWTCNSKLPLEQQLLFEPWRNDKAALAEKNNNWQKKLSQNYGRWLNNQLNKRKKLALTPIQSRLWSDIFSHELREYVAIQEVVL